MLKKIPIQKPYGWKKNLPLLWNILEKIIDKKKKSPPNGTLLELKKGEDNYASSMWKPYRSLRQLHGSPPFSISRRAPYLYNIYIIYINIYYYTHKHISQNTTVYTHGSREGGRVVVGIVHLDIEHAPALEGGGRPVPSHHRYVVHAGVPLSVQGLGAKYYIINKYYIWYIKIYYY